MPETRIVIAPKSITGQFYPAYLCKPNDTLKRTNLTMAIYIKRNGKGYYVNARDFVELTKHRSEQSAHYILALKYLTPEQIKASPQLINPFPLMVHKGEIKLFSVETNKH